VALFASGCIEQELLTPHVEPGGTVTAILGQGMPHQSTGLGDATKDPFSLSGYSPFLTFGLVAPGAMATLATNNATMDLTIPSAQLEIHSDGMGCSATSGTIHLTTDGSGHVAGSFTADGTVSGGTDACSFSGTLDSIPLDR
jgi:hypothetical protein